MVASDSNFDKLIKGIKSGGVNSSDGSSDGAPKPPDFYDKYRSFQAQKDIRKGESEYGGVPDTRLDDHQKLTQEEQQVMQQLASQYKVHPALLEAIYFSGLEDFKNNPLYRDNPEAMDRLLNELRKELALKKQLSNDFQQRFNPKPDGPM